jgi:hypothetical protein
MKEITKKIYGHYRTHTCTVIRKKLHEWHLQMAGSGFHRCGSDDDGIVFVDPSGGPFFARDASLREYSKELPDVKIKSIVRKDNEYFLLTEPKKREKKNL